MKQLSLLIFLLAVAVTASAQSIETPQPLTKEDYLRKSRQQRTAAWVFSGVGLAGILGAAGAGVQHMSVSISLNGNSNSQPEPKHNSYTGLIVAGAVALVTGIGFAVVATPNK